MKSGYRYDAKTCFRCGHLVHYNWYIRHRRSGCVSGIVTPPRLTTGSTVTAAPVDSAAPNLIEAQPQVKPDRSWERSFHLMMCPHYTTSGGPIPQQNRNSQHEFLLVSP